MIAVDPTTGRLVVLITGPDLAELVPFVERARDRHAHVLGGRAPSAVDDLIADGRQVVALDSLRGSLAPCGQTVAAVDVDRAWLSCAEVALLSGKSARTVRREAVAGRLPGSRLVAGRNWLIPATAVRSKGTKPHA